METRHFAVVGLGSMGAAIAHRLLDLGIKVTVQNRTPAKAAPLVEAGAVHAESVRDAVADAEVVMLSLSDETVVEHVLFETMLPWLRPGTVVVDTSTVSPGYAVRAAERLAAAGIPRVEACVVGNPEMAKSGELRVFAAGEPSHVDSVHDVLRALGRHGFRYLGTAGQASAIKLAFNLLLGAQTVALAEAVAFATDAGVDRDMMLDAVVKSGFRSPVLAFRAEFMRTKRYEPAAFRARLMEKDVRLLADHAVSAGLTLPLTEAIADRYADIVAAGDGDRDAAVVLKAHEQARQARTTTQESTKGTTR